MHTFVLGSASTFYVWFGKFSPKTEKEFALQNKLMQGATVKFSFEFDGDAMKGSIATPDGDMDITAKKRSK